MDGKHAAMATTQLETPKRLHLNPNHLWSAQKGSVKEDEEEVVPYN